MGNLKLEVGKLYRTRNGQKGECIYYKHEGFGTNREYQYIVLFENGCHVSYMENGNYWHDGRKYHGDIISEWVETPEELFKRIGFDPTCLPKWGIWVAMDEDGAWCHYEDEPTIQNSTYFYSDVGACGFIPDKYAPKNYTGYWKDSKFKVK